MSQTSEMDLFQVWARRIRTSDSSAFEAFFRAVHPPLVQYAQRYLHDSAAALDVTQDAFIRIWEGRERIDPAQSLKAFAFRTVRNLCLNRIRDGKTRTELLEEEYEPPPTDARRPDEVLNEELLASRLEEWIEDLPDRQREALRLSRFHGLSHQEAADAMGVSARTVNNHLVKALRTIRDRVRAYEPSLLDS